MSDEVVIEDPKAVLAALDRAKADAKRYREEAEALQTQVADLQAKVDKHAETESTWQEKAKLALVTKELNSGNAERIMKFLDIDSIGFDDEGNLTGVEEAVNKVKADLPELFDTKRSVGGEADLFTQGDAPKPLTGSAAQVARIMQRSA